MWLEKREVGTEKANSFCRTERGRRYWLRAMGIFVLLPEGSCSGKPGGTANRGPQVPVLSAVEKVLTLICAREQLSCPTQGTMKMSSAESAC